METIYLGIIIFLFILAVFDLSVGVSNDAVNFLNSAIGAKAASFKVIIAIAAIGIFCGATMSNGMMEIARHGIFRPEQFYFNELICIMLGVMITDVVLLDIFNSLGMPTSTTVSMVFELLGGTFALALVKIVSSAGELNIGELLNTDKALSVILGIFLSVAVAFFFGTLVQFLARTIFTFNYKTRLKWFIGIFGGIATTAIIYFMLIKGIKDSSFMTPENKLWVKENTGLIVSACFIFFTILMQCLHWLKINVFKVIVLLGTFALAMAFAGNDLVNFVGVPLAGFSAYTDFVANGLSVGPDNYLMGSLNEPAKTPFYFLLLAGIIMVIALITSKKAQNVVKTSLDLSRQEEGEEMFGSSAVARSIVRSAVATSNTIRKVIPEPVRCWIDSRFNKDEVIIANGASFDLIRASVNLVMAGLLIALGTSLKLPLSTTYVAFMVAMGSSLADRAWGRESAVFRITGVLSVIGGWFITAGAAFVLCFTIALILYYGGFIAILVMIALAAFILVKSHLKYKKKLKNEKEDALFQTLMSTKDKQEVWSLLSKHVQNTLSGLVAFSQQAYLQVTDAFINEDLRSLRKAINATDNEKDKLKKLRRKETLGLRRIDMNIAIERSTWFHLGSNNAEQLLYSLKRMSAPCKEHVDNNFNPLPEECKEEFIPLRDKLVILMQKVQWAIENNQYDQSVTCEANELIAAFKELRNKQMRRIQEAHNSLKISMVYLNLIQESQEMITTIKHLIRASRKFQI